MALFKTGQTVEVKESLSSEQAQEIYGLFKQGLSHTQMFIQHNVPLSYSTQTWAEIRRLESEVMQKMSGYYEVSPAIPPVMDEDGVTELVKGIPAEYFVPSTQKALVASIESSLLNVETLVSDTIAYHGEYNPYRTWAGFIESFNTPGE